MADPEKKEITAAEGTNFQLRWRIPHSVQSTAKFVDSNGSQDFPDKSCKLMNGAAPTDKPRGTATVTISVKKGPKADSLQPEVFRPNRAPPTLFVLWGQNTNLFAAAFMARDEGVYEFTTVIDMEEKGKPKDTKTFIETVTVTPAADLSDKRQAMLDLFDVWLPTSILGVAYPKKFGDPTKQQDILELSGWSKDKPDWTFTETTYDGSTVEHRGSGQGNQSAEQRKCNDARDAAYKGALQKWKDAGSTGTSPAKPTHQFNIVTSCGSVLGVFLRLWGCDFDNDGKMAVREMSIADDYPPPPKKPTQFGAKHYGYWVDAVDAFKKPAGAGADWKPQYPKAGDVVILWDDDRSIRAHVCMVVSASEDTWTTAEGGGGAIPDQTASQNNKDVTWKKVDADHPKGIPHILDVTSGKSERVTGWVDLDKVPNPKFDASGKKK